MTFFIASGHPDDDAEVVDVNGNQPHIPQPPPIPSIPSIPIYPSVGVPEIPPTGFTPVYNPGFVVDTGVQYVPFGWTYNIFDGFNGKKILFEYLQTNFMMIHYIIF